MESMDTTNNRRCILYMSRTGQLTSFSHFIHDSLLHWSSSCMWSNIWDNPIYFSTIIGCDFRANGCWRELWFRVDSVTVFHWVKILNSKWDFTYGNYDSGMHPSRNSCSFPTVGKYVFSTYKRRYKIQRRILLLF